VTAYLEPGDQIHLIYPSTGDPAKDERLLADLRQGYAVFGVNIAVATTIGLVDPTGRLSRQPEARVLAVFRNLKGSRA
jgi:hypothetical protein